MESHRRPLRRMTRTRTWILLYATIPTHVLLTELYFFLASENSNLVCFLLQQYRENRLNTIDSIKAKGANPYPHKFPAKITVPGYIEKYKGLHEGEKLVDVTESIAGKKILLP